jgi:leucyl aminopeptidase
MKFTVKPANAATEKTPAFVFFVFENELPKSPAGLKKMLESVRDAEFSGKSGQFLLLPTHGKIPAERAAFIGLGKRDKFKLEGARRTAATVARKLRGAGITKFTMEVCADCACCSQEECAEALAQGVVTGLFKFDRFKTGNNDTAKSEVREVTLALASPRGLAAAQKAARRGQIIGDGVNLCREVGNTPPNILYPATLADRARKLARETGMRCTVFDARALKKMECNAILAVGAGSVHEPYLIILEHRGGRAGQRPFAFVGKAITFDSGGLNIKTGLGMADMKWDKCGGCAVLGAMSAIARLKIPMNVIGVISAAENLLDANSYRPSDIMYAYPGEKKGGTSIEVLNTDAEGRMVLSDALSYVSLKHNPRAIVDLATLTGACVTALGAHNAGLMGNNDDLIEKIKAASARSGDPVWQLPISDEYRDEVKSEFADVKNIGGGSAGAQAGAVFLEKFVHDKPWAHLDIAGTAWGDEKPHRAKGATGFGVRLCVELVS